MPPHKPRNPGRAADSTGDPGAEAAPRYYRGLRLNDFQVEALEAIEAGHSVLLSAPTGAGKTLVAEYAIEETLASGKRAIYTAPIKALSNQKYRDFKSSSGFDVGIMTGDVTINADAPLLIMTTEIFRNTIFEDASGLHDVAYVVFDEIHYMDDIERGTVWEESIIFAPPHIKLICLSATVSNLGQFAEWISATRGEPVRVIQSSDRPVPLTHYLYVPGYGAMRADKARSLPRRRRDPHAHLGSDLLDLLERGDKLPVLFFCFSRKECEQRAVTNARRQLLDQDQQAEILRLFDDICERFEVTPDPTLSELRSLAQEGIGYHHAGLLPVHKELVERLFTSGLLKLLFTTETFALGINMPARTVVFASLRKFDGVGFANIKAREYQQMAGRAGRQGIDAEGLVYSLVDPERQNARDIQRVIFGAIEPIQSRFNLSYSSIMNLHRLLKDRIFQGWERSFNNFQWSRMSRKNRERNERRQIEAIERRLRLLTELEYIDAAGVLDRGRVAALINGYELPATELVFSELLDRLDETQINVVLSAIVFEERPNALYRRMDRRVLSEYRADVEQTIAHIIEREHELGIRPATRHPNFNFGAVMTAWCQGASFLDLGDFTNASDGDLVRTFRMTIQLLRQIRKAIPDRPLLADKLGRAIERVNRDAVDAKRQLEMG
ncbi:MAG: DEAD/DEAH box helicase [Planctomycetota bacterium]